MTFPRPPSYPSRAQLAHELDMAESTVDEMVKRGVLPKPVRLSSGCVRWCWADVVAAMDSLKDGAAYDAEIDPYLEGIEKAFKPPEEITYACRVGTIYVVGCGEAYVKIGFTGGEVEWRLKSVQTGSPEPLVLLASHHGRSIHDETALHRRFAEYRTSGEWFRRHGEVAAWVAAGCPVE